MSTRILDDLKRRVEEFNALNPSETVARRLQVSRKLEALMEKLAVERICTGIIKRIELWASIGIKSLEVMKIDGDHIGKGWEVDLFNNVPLEAINDPVTRKVYARLGHMGLRPRIIQDSLGRSQFSRVGGDCFRLIVSWGDDRK